MGWWKRGARSEEQPRESNGAGEIRPASFELFETWLADMDAKLTGFLMFGLPQEWSAKHYTRDALVQLQDVVRDRLDSRAQVRDGSDVAFVDGAIRYVGETLIRQFGGRWIFQGRPRLVLDVPGVTDDDPIDVRGVLENVVRYRDKDVLGRLIDIHWTAAQELGAQELGAQGPAFSRRDSQVDPESRLGRWLASMDQDIEIWRQGPAAPAQRWDGSVASLALLGPWLLETFAAGDIDIREEDSLAHPAFVGACRYLGDTVRRHGGGQWAYPEGARSQHNPYVGRPYVRREDPDNGELTGEMSVEISVWRVIAKRDASSMMRNIERYLRAR